MSSRCAERRRARPLLGTLVEIEVTAENEEAAQRALEAGFSAVARVDRAMSFHSADSELSRIHRDAWRSDTRVDGDTWRVLRASRALSVATGGVFDCTVASRLVAAGRLPRPQGSPDPVPDGNWRDVDLRREGFVRLSRPVWLDLGGIAKGYALDVATRAMATAGAVTSRVDAGGDIRVRSARSAPVFVRHPSDRSRAFAVGSLQDGAMATTAPYHDETGEWSGVVVPSGKQIPIADSSVTVFARRGIWADALTKVVAIAPDSASAILRRLGADALEIASNGEARWCPTDGGAPRGWSLGPGQYP